MNGGGAASGVGAAEGRGQHAFCKRPAARAEKRGIGKSRRASGQDERAPGTPILPRQPMSEVEQLLTRESPGLAGAGELA